MTIEKFNVFTKEDDLVRQHVRNHSFYIANVLQSADTTANKDHDLLVPDGYEVAILRDSVTSNEARIAGTATVKVTVDGTAITNGPEAVIDATNTLTSESRIEPGSVIVAAGSVISVLATGDGTWAPATADFAVTVDYYLNPVP